MARQQDRQSQSHRVEVSLRVSQVQLPQPRHLRCSHRPTCRRTSMFPAWTPPRAEVRRAHGLLQEREAAHLRPLLLRPARSPPPFNAFNNMWDLDYAQNITNGRNFIIGDDFTLNPTTVLQLRYSFTRHYENQGGDPRQNGIRHLPRWDFPPRWPRRRSTRPCPT